MANAIVYCKAKHRIVIVKRHTFKKSKLEHCKVFYSLQKWEIPSKVNSEIFCCVESWSWICLVSFRFVVGLYSTSERPRVTHLRLSQPLIDWLKIETKERGRERKKAWVRGFQSDWQMNKIQQEQQLKKFH